MPELTTYLKNLQFDHSQDKTLFAKFLKNTRLVVLIVLLVVLIGTVSFLSIPRVLNPEIKIPIVSIQTTLPGASPQDIETLVTVPIEDSVDGVTGIKTVTSTSQDSVSVVTLEFDSGIDPDKAKADVQSAVDTVNDLPDNAATPRVQKFDFSNEPVLTFILSSDKDYVSLDRFSINLRDRLKELNSVDRVEATGIDDEEIQITIKPDKMAVYGINPAVIAQTIKSTLGSFPAGAVNTSNSSFVLSMDPTVTTIEELRELSFTSNGTTYLLSDVADIQRRTKPNPATSYFATSGQAPVGSIRFDVYKTSTANITTAVDDAKKLTNDIAKQYGDKFTISYVQNSGELIDQQFYDLVRDLLLTVFLVFITLFLFLGIRQAVVASFAIPLTFLVTFTVMNITGIDLSFIAFFSLLLSLGLLVDDTIVVISAVTAYYRTGKFTPYEAAVMVWRDFRTAIVTTTLTTVWAFVPLLLSTGIIGEFIKPIPIVVSSTLLGSLAVAIFITLPVIIILLKANIPHRVTILLRILGVLVIFGIFLALAPQGPLFIPALLLFAVNLFIYFQVRYFLFNAAKKRIANSRLATDSTGKKRQINFSEYVNHGVINFEIVEKKYRALIDRILSKGANRKATMIAVITFTLFSFLLLPLGFVRNEFFPANDQDYVFVSLELPAGTNLDQTRQETLRLLNELRNTPDVLFSTASLRLSIDPGRGYSSGNDNVSLITLVLPNEHDRSRSSIEIAQALRKKYASYSKGTLSVVEATDGPPAGSDIQIKLSGDDLTVLDSYANKLQDHLKNQPGTNNVSKSIKAGTSKIVFVPDKQKLLAAGISEDQLGLFMRTYVTGFTLDEKVRLDKGVTQDEDIVLRTSATAPTTDIINSIAIPTQNGPVSLNSLGTFELRTNPTRITREDGKRTLSVSAGVDKGFSISEKNTDLTKFADTLNLPNGYSWSTGGVNEENERSVTSILQAMILSFLLIIITMVLQFSSFRKAFIVMLVIPLSISGVFIIFALTNTPLSFPALIGVLALFGIVVKNSILIVDKINQNLSEKMEFNEAIVDASESRLEPITLTTFATIVGLIPITLSDPLWRGLGGAIISGLFFSGTLMLIFIPVVYYYMFVGSEGKEK